MSFVAVAIGSTLVGAATTIYGTNKAASASKSATNASVGEQARQYDQTRADFAPYREVGVGALGKLGDIYGVARATPQVGGPEYKAAFQEWYAQRLPEVKARKGDWNKAVEQFNGVWDKGINTGVWDTIPDPVTGAPPSGNRNFTHGNPAGGHVGTQPAPGQPGQTNPGGGFTPPATGGPVDRYAGFTASPGYQFRLDQGNKAIARSASAQGKLFSGDALKATADYSQGIASDEWQKWVNGLQSLAGVGQSATGSTAAAGANSANQISNAYLNQGNAVGSSYLAQGQGINNALQGGISNFMLYKYLNP